MHILKPHNDFSNIMSIYKTLFKSNKCKLMLQEYYNPHFLEFTLWMKEDDTGMYVLKRWYKIALNKYARAVKKLNKLDSRSIKIKAYIEKIAKRGNNV